MKDDYDQFNVENLKTIMQTQKPDKGLYKFNLKISLLK